jgi:hypothetical protein
MKDWTRDIADTFAHRLCDLHRTANAIGAYISGRVGASQSVAWLKVQQGFEAVALRFTDFGVNFYRPDLVPPIPGPNSGPLTAEDHWQLGGKLHGLHSDTIHVAREMQTYLDRTVPLLKKMRPLYTTISRLQSSLDELLKQRYPARHNKQIYYPGSSWDTDPRNPKLRSSPPVRTVIAKVVGAL